ncbi:MAG TPA: type II toxin-antitoxin system prevent-host-death family antitoxin [Natronosporangium sp.]|nr:type II toxin-antitoxin system prevent-host-death family antitoxin [Natronosporangium sp.]
MTVMTATEVARNFSSVLDAVARGETIVITRGGRRVAALTAAPAANGAAVREALARHRPDPAWADEIEAVRELLYVEERG